MFEEFEKIENADLKNWSTMKTGGKARMIIFPKNHLEVAKIMKICEKNAIKTLILGNGSNILFDDKGFDGVIISLKHLNKIKVCKDDLSSCNCVEMLNDGFNENKSKSVIVGAGANLFFLNQKLAQLGLSGLEWSYGIPATLGGLLVMNGGCFGHEICEVVEEVVVLDKGKVKRLKKCDLKFSYRYSNLGVFVILSAKMRLFCEKTEKIKQNMDFFLKKKRESQPCEFPSLGSVFKRIGGKEIVFPAKLIDEMGLKGTKIGGAQVSEKHAGFVVNTGNATSTDVILLIEFLEKKLADVGFHPEREIIVLREDE